MTKRTHPIDIEIGRRVRERRLKTGVSQTQLADKLDLTFQQIQKYESGANRISGSKLYQIAKALKVPVATLFPD